MVARLTYQHGMLRRLGWQHGPHVHIQPRASAGFIIGEPFIPKWVIWLYWLNPVSWTVYGVVASQLADITDQFVETVTLHPPGPPIPAHLTHHARAGEAEARMPVLPWQQRHGGGA